MMLPDFKLYAKIQQSNQYGTGKKTDRHLERRMSSMNGAGKAVICKRM